MTILLFNGTGLCEVAAPVAAVTRFERMLNGKDIICRRVQYDHAFHSRMLDSIVPTFEEAVRQVSLEEPTIPYISNVTGAGIERSEALSPAHWGTHAPPTAPLSGAVHEVWRVNAPCRREAGAGPTVAP